MANKTNEYIQKVEASGTLLLTAKDKKRLARVLKDREQKTATYLREVVLRDVVKYEAKRARANG